MQKSQENSYNHQESSQNRMIPRLPAGFGTIRYLGTGRTRPYAVHPPARKESGRVVRPKAFCYTESWLTGFAMLVSFHAGTYTEGLENRLELALTEHFFSIEEPSDLEIVPHDPSPSLAALISRLLSDFRLIRSRGSQIHSATFAEVYAKYYDYKYGPHAARKLSRESMNSVNAAFEKLRPIHDRMLDVLGVSELQELVNSLADGCSFSALRNVLTLIHGLYAFAYPRELCRKTTGSYVTMPAAREVVHHEAFSDEEMQILWRHRENPTIRMILVMCYSGFRIGAFVQGMETDLAGRVFRGGIKTKAGKGRTVPIHSCLLPLLRNMQDSEGRVVYLCGKRYSQFLRDMKSTLQALGMRPLTPHSCRHTFNRMLEQVAVGEADRKRLMGHSLKQDLLNGTYGHRGIEELRSEIEKLNGPTLG